MKKVVFISLPMSGHSGDSIRARLALAKEAYLQQTGADITEVAFCHNFQDDEPAVLNGVTLPKAPVYYLGKALIQIAKCDEVYFFGDWKNARGCQTEHEVCERYYIPYLEQN